MNVIYNPFSLFITSQMYVNKFQLSMFAPVVFPGVSFVTTIL